MQRREFDLKTTALPLRCQESSLTWCEFLSITKRSFQNLPESQQPAIQKPLFPEIGRFGSCVDELGVIGNFVSEMLRETLKLSIGTFGFAWFFRSAYDGLLRKLKPQLHRQRTREELTDQSAFEDIVSIQLNFVGKDGTFKIRTVYEAPLKVIIIDDKSLDYFEDAKNKVKNLEKKSISEGILPDESTVFIELEYRESMMEDGRNPDEWNDLLKRLARLIEGKMSEIFAQGHLEAAFSLPDVIEKRFKWVMTFECGESRRQSTIQSKYRILLVDQALLEEMNMGRFGHSIPLGPLHDEGAETYFVKRWRILELFARKDGSRESNFFSGP
ncbi:hypothetical protein CYMTET_40015 [Cymbomonas tetramitiformis]|uniref:Uncharacterized protein n=1 Tax=Cymbomonas tetramitiformis TaxID=36881 RepID=A0AAE0F3E1_9CHLO|nr:hypothetical protein CYMTET_40015 [Cymbomonas tetramitiformis]